MKIEETLVSYELAEILDKFEIENYREFSLGFNYRIIDKYLTDNYFQDEGYKAYPLYFIQKWLREKYNIEVIVAPKYYRDENFRYIYECLDMENNNTESLKELFKGMFSLHETYEEALNKGILEAIKLIK